MYISDIHVHRRFEIFLNFANKKKSENISDCDSEVYVNHLDKLRDFKICFWDLDNAHVPEWLTPFHMKMIIKVINLT